MRENAFFLLDSPRPSSLTLRDYSKVVAAHKRSFSKEKLLPSMPGGSMPSLRARWSVVCLIVVFSLCMSTLLFAQSTGGRILGRVADPTGAVLANVKITLVNDATGISNSVQTNDSGEYVFPHAVVGSYHLEFDLTGFKKDIRRGVAVDLNQVVTLNMVMQIGGAQEIVDV